MLTEEKKIKDYLHLYLGCEVMYIDGMSLILKSISINRARIGAKDDDVHFNVPVENFKPILRPLSDMSEEEFKECDLKTHPKFWMTDSSIWCFTAEKTRYLLSKQFDLFNLHEAGLCLYKTDLK